jgi:putative methyltransferase (TIGR04325 family)
VNIFFIAKAGEALHAMNPFKLMHRGVDSLRRFPVIRQTLQARFRREFLHDPYARLFDGVYATFEDALRAAPTQKPTSYDNDESIERYVRRQDIDEYDYPPLFWITESFNEGLRSVSDIGGSVGIKFYAFSKCTQFPEDVTWRVIDVPAAVAMGRELARKGNADRQLSFSDDVGDADGCDVMLCLGSLQFLPQTLAELVASLEHRPARIVVNTTPIHETRSFFTLHSMGTAICPYRVTSRKAFVDDMAKVGYRVRHSWLNANKDMVLRFHDGFDVPHFSGFCFERNR